MADLGVNNRELVERIWAEVAAQSALQTGPSLEPLPPFERLTHHEERRYLNEHWVFDRTPSVVECGGVLRGFKRRAKARAGQFIMRVLQRYFDEDQEFRAHLVRLQNTLTDEHDRVRAEVRQVHEALRAEAARLLEATGVMHNALEERVSVLEMAVRRDATNPAG